MRSKSGEDDVLYLRMSRQILRHRHTVGIVAIHAHGQGLDAARYEKAIHRSQSRSRRALHKINFLGLLSRADDYRSPGAIAMAVQKFGHGMNHDVRAERERLL